MSNIYQAVIVDDEENCRLSLEFLLKKYAKDIQVVASAATVEEGIKVIQQTNPNVVFLDIELPDGDGFSILEKLIPLQFKVIFVTAHNEYAIKAFKFSAIDYILKPVDPELLVNATKRLFENENFSAMNQQIDTLIGNRNNFTKIVLPSHTGYSIVEVNNIIRCEASSNYTTFYLKNGEKILVCKTLKVYEDLLSESNFFRIHQSHLINFEFIKEYRKTDGSSVVMTDGSVLEISRRKKDEFLSKLFGNSKSFIY